MRFKIIPFVMLIAPISFAETENFNMAVDGNFITDFCTINTPITNFNFGTIDATDLSSLIRSSAAQDATGKTAYIIPLTQTMSFTCAYGTNIEVFPDIPNSGQLVGSSTVIGFNISEQLVPNFVQVASNSNPLEIHASGDEQLLDVEMWFSSLTTLSDLENSVNAVIPWVLRTK